MGGYETWADAGVIRLSNGRWGRLLVCGGFPAGGRVLVCPIRHDAEACVDDLRHERKRMNGKKEEEGRS
jgi:hypothetical protein